MSDNQKPVSQTTAGDSWREHRRAVKAARAARDARVPEGACGKYTAFNGEDTWIKDLDQKNPSWPLAYVWSYATNRWRSKREKIDLTRVKLFETGQST